MDDLIEALTILKKYLSGFYLNYPTGCAHDELIVHGVEFKKMTPIDLRRLYELGFMPGADYEYVEDAPETDDKSTNEELQEMIDFAKEHYESMHSYRFGSC